MRMSWRKGSNAVAACLTAMVATNLVILSAFTVPVQAQTVGDARVDPMQRSPSEGGTRRWIAAGETAVPLLKASGAGAVEVGRIVSGDVLDNLGCTVVAGVTWCKVRPLGSRKTGYLSGDHLAPAVGPDGVIAIGEDDSGKRVMKRQFDRTGKVACAQERGEKLGTCRFGVASSGGGDATALITFPNGFTRRLFFRHGRFMSASATMSGAGRDTDWTLTDGLHAIRVDDQRYEIPDNLIFGK